MQRWIIEQQNKSQCKATIVDLDTQRQITYLTPYVSVDIEDDQLMKVHIDLYVKTESGYRLAQFSAEIENLIKIGNTITFNTATHFNP